MPKRVVRVVGDCLAPRLRSGDLLYVDPGRPRRVGDVVVACWEGLTLIGELAEWEGRRWLVGSQVEPLHLGPRARILGVGAAIVRQL